ncbi:MAG: hypothetical protein JRF56_14050 [Deltaproteobacteria bacterium]|jgi:hypothetical protein|nr:hypothetical protein [Deltaproteobacteria bacterium]
MNWLNVIIGILLLFVGRRLFWLFVACVGFASGYHYAQQIWGLHSAVLILILSIAAGAVGAIIAIFFQKTAIVVAGFAAGGHIVLSLSNQFAGLPAQLVWLPYIIGGIIGAIILLFVFDWALIILSTLTGATLIVQMVAFKPWVEIISFLALVIAGMVFQAKTMTAERRARLP